MGAFPHSLCLRTQSVTQPLTISRLRSEPVLDCNSLRTGTSATKEPVCMSSTTTEPTLLSSPGVMLKVHAGPYRQKIESRRLWGRRSLSSREQEILNSPGSERCCSLMSIEIQTCRHTQHRSTNAADLKSSNVSCSTDDFSVAKRPLGSLLGRGVVKNRLHLEQSRSPVSMAAARWVMEMERSKRARQWWASEDEQSVQVSETVEARPQLTRQQPHLKQKEGANPE